MAHTRRKYPRYVHPGKEFGDAAFADLAESHGAESQLDPELERRTYYGSHRVHIRRRERVGAVSVMGHGSFELRDDVDREAILVEDPQSGDRFFIPRQNIFMFFWTALERFGITQTWNTAEEQEAGSVALALESRRARSRGYDTDADIRARGGNPEHRSEFKHPHRPVRVR